MFEGGIFGDLFDLNGDGKMDAGEMALEFMVIDEITKGEDDVDEDTPFDTGCCDFYGDDDDELTIALEAAGLDKYALELMDEEERAEILKDHGLDPNDYDVW
jgi:hypothetical protein